MDWPKKTFRFLITNWKKIIPWVVLAAILLANSLYASYPDEFDNILGGKLILQGKLPYLGFFSHHGPLAYFLSGILVLIGGRSFVHFRLLTAFFFLGVFLVYYLILTKILPKIPVVFFWVFAFLTALAVTYFWGQMFLADPLSGYFLIPAYLVLLYRMYYQEKLSRKDIWIISLATGLSVINSQTYLYGAAVIYFVTTVYQVAKIEVKKHRLGDLAKNILGSWVILGLPYLVFGIYLLVTGSVSSFIDEAINYNQKYYIYNYPRPADGSSFINPIRYAIVIFNSFFVNFQLALGGIFQFNPNIPMVHVLAVTDAILVVWLMFRKRFLAAFLVFFSLVFVTARGNPSQVNNTDYQTAVYFLLSILNFSLIASFLVAEVKKLEEPLPRIIFSLLGFVLGVLWFFAAIYLFSENWRIKYEQYMGTAPLIYDRPVVAPVLNAVLTKDDYCWVGPFEFEEMLYLKCRLPSKYTWILPQFLGIPKYQQEILADFSKTKPKVVVFRRDYSAFGQSSAFNTFFVDFLNQNYVRARDLPQFKAYRFPDEKLINFHPNDDYNFLKENAPETIQKLIDLGYLKKG